jgi:hypothetical protein
MIFIDIGDVQFYQTGLAQILIDQTTSTFLRSAIIFNFSVSHSNYLICFKSRRKCKKKSSIFYRETKMLHDRLGLRLELVPTNV